MHQRSFHLSRGAIVATLCCAALASCVFSARTALPLPVRNERGEGHSAADTPAHLQAARPSSPQPSPPSAGGEGEEIAERNTFRASAPDTVQLSTNYYNISGATEMELRQSIKQSRPWKDKDATDARTEWKIQWTYSTKPSDGGYRLRSLETKTTITYTLPRWAPGPASPKLLSEHWAKYSAALRTHEEGHARIAVVAAGEIRKRVNALPEAPTARRLERQINDIADKVVAEYREVETTYDKKTIHGASQGAHFP